MPQFASGSNKIKNTVPGKSSNIYSGKLNSEVQIFDFEFFTTFKTLIDAGRNYLVNRKQKKIKK